MKFVVISALFLAAGAAGAPPKYKYTWEGSYTVCTQDSSRGTCERFLKDGTPSKDTQKCDGPKPCFTTGNGCTMNYNRMLRAACSA
ncbi:hypothetical protein Vi05172_g9061 [Venturia inaequalis]|nr:hypothetical protein Vi05172_g9061 [Venturia inaequalis]